MKRIIRRAMQQSDDLVLQFDYTDSKGVQTRRVVSPIRFLGADRFLGLCLSREEPRQFHISNCRNAQLGLACDMLMPVPLVVTSSPAEVAGTTLESLAELAATVGSS